MHVCTHTLTRAQVVVLVQRLWRLKMTNRSALSSKLSLEAAMKIQRFMRGVILRKELMKVNPQFATKMQKYAHAYGHTPHHECRPRHLGRFYSVRSSHSS